MKKNKKKIIIAVICIIAVWLIMGIVDFTLVHNYRKPLFCVGVDLADDGGSGRYVGLGYSFEIEGNFMPDTETPATEDKKPKVTSYRGYIFGKEVSRGFWDEMLPTPYKNMEDVIENAPSIQGNVTEVYEDYMIIHFVTSGYPYGANCKVTLSPVFGDSYTDVSIGDEVVVYFNGDIMETDPLLLGTVYAITLKTPANRVGSITMPDEITEVEVSGYYNGGVINPGDFVIKDFEAFKAWFTELSFEHREFAEGKTPGETIAGWNSYQFDVNNGVMVFAYADCGVAAYIVYENEWYEIANPTEPPYSSIVQGTSESITVEYHGAGQIKKWSVSAEFIDDVTEWYDALDYKKVTFKDGESPSDGEGQAVYCIEFSDGTIFDYFDCGTEHYIRIDGTWYKVKNPKLPPVGASV